MMNYRDDGHNTLIRLQEMLISSVINPSPNWDDNHIEALTNIHKATYKLLSTWNDSVVMTSKGYALVPGRRNRIIGQMTKMIVNIQTLSQNMDEQGKILLAEIDQILEDLSAMVLGMTTLEDSA